MKPLHLAIALLATATTVGAQTPQWDHAAYPDYNPIPHVDQQQHHRMQQRVAARRASGQTRPDHWNNAQSSAFPAVINQEGGSCGSASRVHYMFTHELNAARRASASDDHNIYPTHFTWLHTRSYGQTHDKEQIAMHNGIPNIIDYEGTLYSKLFGFQEDTNNDFGWMQGYSKWFNAMHNRISTNANFSLPLNTEEGREIVKNYLWNHCGDDSYSTGGVVGIGVAAGGTWATIGSTPTNNSIGVTGQYYVKAWGEAINHALTIVGYDDRIEFDLDGDGVYGDPAKDELGAWIVVNSWGAGWCNGGFIYCPYAESRPTATATGYWQPEYYTPLPDYRPLRTIKLSIDYDRRSEIALHVGVAADLNATKPEVETWMRHFQFCGDANYGNSNPAPEVPMLGRWADGMLHTEPMEFGYDITSLTAHYPAGKPLKYFFWVETRSWGAGSGHINSASIIDYTVDRDGIETPFAIPDGGVAIASAGSTTTITTTAINEAPPSPRNLSISDGTLTWQAPIGTPYSVNTYNIYANGNLVATTRGNVLQADAADDATYTVTATYHINGYDVESEPTAAVRQQATDGQNSILVLNRGSQFTVPSFTTDALSAYTIEFYVYPRAISGECFGIKASSGKFFFKVNSSKKIEVGYDGGDYATSSTTLSASKWTHVAIAFSGTNIKVYLNGTLAVNKTSGYGNSGISGANDLLFGKTEGTTSHYKEVVDAAWYAYVDELRIWNYARSQNQIYASLHDVAASPFLHDGLTHNYSMSTLTDANGQLLLLDGVGNNHATVATPAQASTQQTDYSNTRFPFSTMSSGAAISTSTSQAKVGEAVTLAAIAPLSTTSYAWTLPGTDIATSTVPSPTVVFTKAGTYTLTLETTNLLGTKATAQATVEVAAASVPTPSFTVPEGTLRAGDHVTFINTTPDTEGMTFAWEMTGAQRPEASTVNAAATYDDYGTYTVRLTATNAAGSRSTERTVTISKVAPEAAFTIHNNVAIVGEKVYLEDASRFSPSEWSWTVSSEKHTYAIAGQNNSITFAEPGIYDVTLHAANDIGTSSASRARAIVVCAADGGYGLHFDAEDDELVAASPLTTTATGFTAEWWMYPGQQADSGLGMGDKESTFLITTSATGAMNLYKNGQVVSTPDGFVIENEWHHYAVTSNGNTVTFLRDGVSISTATLSGSVPVLSQWRIGGSEHPANAIIDELRLWKTALTATNIFRYCNGPLTSTSGSLLLYYNFNQQTGDAIDSSSKGLTGYRHNFGPDGDAWATTKGIFYLNNSKVSTSDVTATYLRNYRSPFTTANTYVNGTSRFKTLATGTSTSPWVQENSVVDGSVRTEWHVDANKSSYLTLSTTWDGFAAKVTNLKLYQTVTLPAGVYELTAVRGNHEWQPSGVMLVAAEGVGLPDANRLATDALAYAPCGSTCTIILYQATQVSLGLVASKSGTTCHTISSFNLQRKAITTLDTNNEVGISQPTSATTTATLTARGGIGVVSISVSEPQRVDIHDVNGRLVSSTFIQSQTRIPLRRGLYLVGRSKIVVK